MKDGLFHRQIGFPAGATVLFLGTLDLDYGPHSVKEASVDRYGEVALPSTVTVQQADVVEVSIERGEPVKALLRLPLDARRDICIVVSTPLQGLAFVRTVWVNLKSDTHRTLDRSKYRKP